MLRNDPIRIKLLTSLAILFLFMTGCVHIQGEETKKVPLTTVLGSELNDTSQVYVRYGDGKELTISDIQSLRKITTLLKTMQLSPIKSVPGHVGQLYTLKITDGSKTVEYASSLFINGKQYTMVDEAPQKDLDQYLITIGREKFPNLLPGIK